MVENEYLVRRAVAGEAIWVVNLSARVQSALTASGSLQKIGPLPLPMVETSIRGGHLYCLDLMGRQPTGSVQVDPLDGNFPNTRTIDYISWGAKILPGPYLYLHALMIEPTKQGNGLGLVFLEGVLRLMDGQKGTILLDCWAGNAKLRKFYEGAGFTHHGNFLEEDYEISVYVYALSKRP
jgi:GNAT superfamily N-acetyltransferase